MKYHSTKKSVITITIIIVLLLLISAIGIFKFQARTPVQAVSNAIFSNLEMPNDYKIEVTNINESFLLRQKIESINLLKNDNTILSVKNLEINQNIFNYLSYLLFNKELNFNIKADSLDVNICCDISDLMQSLSKIKIKDNTIAIQSKLEQGKIENDKEPIDFRGLLDQIIQQKYIDLSPLISSKILQNNYKIEIDSGSISLENESINLNSQIDKLAFHLEKGGILNQFDFSLSALNFNNKNLLISTDVANLNFDNKIVKLDSKVFHININDNVLNLDDLEASYNLEQIGQVFVESKNLAFTNNSTIVNISDLQSQIKTNFSDFSIILSPKNTQIYLNNDYIKFQKANLGLSSVKNRLSFYFNNEDLLSLFFNNQLININDIDLSLLSTNKFFDKSNLRIGSFEYKNDTLDTFLSNLKVKLNSNIDDQILISDGKIDFNKLNKDNLLKLYKSVSLSLSSNLNLLIDEYSINSSIYSDIELEDNLKNITASLISNDIKFNDLPKTISLDVNLQGPIVLEEGKVETLEANLNYGESLLIKSIGNFDGSFENNKIKTTLLFDDFTLNEVSSLLLDKVPALKNYISDQTKLKGSLNYEGNIPLSNNKIMGNLNSSLLVKQAIFLDNEYNLGLNFNTDVNNNDILVDQLSISLFNYRLAFSGDYYIDKKDLNGDLTLENIESGDKLVYINFEDNDLQNSTNFDLRVTSLNDFSLAGDFKRLSKSVYQVNSLINLKNDVIDLDIIGDIENLVFNARSNKGLLFDLSIDDSINVDLDFNNFNLIDLDNSTFNGNLVFSFKNTDLWDLDISGFNFSYNSDQFNLLVDGSIAQNSINLDRVDYYNNKFDTKFYGQINYSGPKYYDLIKNRFSDKYNLSFSFGDRINQMIEASLFNNDKLSNIFLDINNFNISRLFNNEKEILLDTRIIGSTDFSSNNQIKGSINFNETGAINEVVIDGDDQNSNQNLSLFNNSLFDRIVSVVPFLNLPTSTQAINLTHNNTDKIQTNTKTSFSANLTINDDDYLLEDLNLILPSISLKNASIDLNLKQFNLLLASNIEYIKPTRNTDQKSTCDLAFNLNFNSFIQKIKQQFSINKIDLVSVQDIYQRLRNYKEFDYSLLDDISGYLNVDNIDLFKDTIDFEKLWDDEIDDNVNLSDINSTFLIKDGKINISDDNIKGNIDFVNKEGTINIDKGFGFAGNFEFDYKNTFDVYIGDIDFPIAILQKLLYKNLFKLYGENLKGNLLLKDVFNDLKYYGELTSKDFRLKTLYTKKNEMSIPNFSVIFDEDRLYSSKVNANFYDRENNKIIKFQATSQMDMPKLKFNYFSIDMYCPDYIPMYIPIIGMNLTIDVEAKNYFNYASDGATSYLNGDLEVRNAVIRSGINLPAWIKPRQETNGDIKFLTAENNSFYYPYLDNPILSLTMQSNQKVELKFDTLTKTSSATGEVDIQQGEIFYFQKNFYINSGKLSLRLNSETQKLEPIVSLDATLRELDAEGKSVDITLNLNNSTLDNFNPVFTSSPVKTQREIMEILGQSISSNNSNDANSVASIATAATSIFSSLGYLETGGVSTLNKTIASTLNLDFFSLKSNIVENIILETFIEDPRYSSFSPLARYLNNTTIFMGKYLTPNSKFQVMINLLAKNEDEATSFLANDLSLDLEMSYEIDTELAKFSFFTNPSQLSILKILDTMGFSVTKTIHFR